MARSARGRSASSVGSSSPSMSHRRRGPVGAVRGRRCRCRPSVDHPAPRRRVDGRGDVFALDDDAVGAGRDIDGRVLLVLEGRDGGEAQVALDVVVELGGRRDVIAWAWPVASPYASTTRPLSRATVLAVAGMASIGTSMTSPWRTMAGAVSGTPMPGGSNWDTSHSYRTRRWHRVRDGVRIGCRALSEPGLSIALDRCRVTSRLHSILTQIGKMRGRARTRARESRQQGHRVRGLDRCRSDR